MVGLEVVVVGVELGHDAVGEHEHAVDDADKYFAHSTVNEGEIRYIGCTREVQFQGRRIDEGDLSSAYQRDDVGEWAEKDGKSAV